MLFLLDSRLGNATDFLRDNRCISPFSLNGRPMADMRQIGAMKGCRREDVLKEEEEKSRFGGFSKECQGFGPKSAKSRKYILKKCQMTQIMVFSLFMAFFHL